ncbi:MAG TPA: hypothetical protein VEQ11_20070 [Chloroflexota bacterium]|nr:hypothetical protein [Chloroflexota bacterium]
MRPSAAYSRLNIYVDDASLRQQVKIAAAQRGVTLSAYCVEAIRRRLVEDGLVSARSSSGGPKAAARALDVLRRRVGPIGVPVRDLIAEGRR